MFPFHSFASNIYPERFYKQDTLFFNAKHSFIYT